MAGKTDEQFSDKEAKARFEAALKGAMSAPHKPLKKKAKTTSRAKKAKASKKGT